MIWINIGLVILTLILGYGLVQYARYVTREFDEEHNDYHGQAGVS